MKLIVGLGNPGKEYQHTRHNIGFDVIDAIVEQLKIELNKNNFDGVYFVNQDFILAKPHTYMNRSGKFVKELVDFYKITPQNILVIRDDLDIPFGSVKLRISGGSGGHNGMKDIIEKIQSNEINQLKIGIGRPSNPHESISSFVLSKFNDDEMNNLKILIDNCVDAVMSSVYNGFKNTMNNFYRGKK